MLFLQFTPVVLSFWLLGAHFLHIFDIVFAMFFFFFPILFLSPRRWIAHLAQILLAYGTLEWIGTIIRISLERKEAGEPYLRMTIIMGAVTLLTFAAIFSFYLPLLRTRFFATAPVAPSPQTQAE